MIEPEQGSLPLLAYRTGTYSTFLAQMLERLHTQAVPVAGGRSRYPLAGVHTTASDDLLIALIKAWAVVGDVLAFYQERIANEGYLRTATEHISVVELARTIGTPSDPGLAASVPLAFTVGESAGLGPDVSIPAGTRVQSLPGPSGLPQIFETIIPIRGRPEFSALRLAPPEIGRTPIAAGATELHLRGAALRLEKGDRLVIIDEAAPASDRWRWYAVVLDSVEPHPDAGWTRVTWLEPPGPPASDLAVAAPCVLAFRQRARLFGFDAPEWSALSEDQKRRAAPPVGPLAFSFAAGDSWSTAVGGAPEAEVIALTIDARGRVFAAAAGGFLLRSTDLGANWEDLGAGLMRREVRSLTVDSYNAVLAGTVNGGVFRSTDGGLTWQPLSPNGSWHPRSFSWGPVRTALPDTVVRALGAYLDPRTGIAYVFAATSSGVLRTRAHADGWTPLNAGLPTDIAGGDPSGVVVNAIAIHAESRHVYIGTSHGVFYSRDRGEHWIAVNKGLPTRRTDAGPRAVAVSALVTYTAGQRAFIFAATEAGLFRSASPETAWTDVSLELAAATETPAVPPPVAALAALVDLAAPAVTVFAATDRGVFRSRDDGQTWTAVGPGSPGPPVRALAVYPGGHVVSSVPVTSTAGDEWPRFGLEDGVLDLDRTHLNVVPPGWVLLSQPQPDDAELLALCQVQHTSQHSLNAFSRQGSVTHLQVRTDPPGLGAFDRRRTEVAAASERLTVIPRQVGVARGTVLVLAEPLRTPFEPGRSIIVQGKRIWVRVAPGRVAPELIPAFGDTPLQLATGDTLEVLGQETEAADARQHWRLRLSSGAEGRVHAPAEDFQWVAAPEQAPLVAEAATVEAVVGDDGHGHARLTLRRPLAQVYDAATVVIHANVALATHGETVEEVLGSGDYTEPNQQFTLRRTPLTCFVLPGAVEAISTLNVWVNGIRWRAVDSRDEAGPHDQCYSVRIDADGRAHVQFGDGIKGARLPSGTENVRAAYRCGTGPDGEVAAGSLIHLLTRPLGVRGVTNPLAPVGASSRAATNEIRQRAPRALARRDRIVSLRDFGAFIADRVPDAKVDVCQLNTGRRRLVHVTIADPHADEFADSDVGPYTALQEAVYRYRASVDTVQIDACQRRRFALEVDVQVADDRRPSDMAESLRALLTAAFSFERRALGQSVTTAEVMRFVHGLPGVRAVHVTRLAHLDLTSEPASQTVIAVERARWDPIAEVAMPAQLLLIDAASLVVKVSV